MLTYSFADIGSDSLYEHLYKCIKNDIKKGVLGKNEKLPSKRSLAKNLGISVITVENAYAQLIAEGYIYSIAKKGYYVSDIKDTYDWDSDYEVNRHERGMSDNMKNSARQIEIVKEKAAFVPWWRRRTMEKQYRVPAVLAIPDGRPMGSRTM